MQTTESDDSLTTDSQFIDSSTPENKDPQTTATATTTENVIQERAGGDGSGNNIGDFITVALGVVVLLIGVLLVAGIIAYRMRRKKKGKISRLVMFSMALTQQLHDLITFKLNTSPLLCSLC